MERDKETGRDRCINEVRMLNVLGSERVNESEIELRPLLISKYKKTHRHIHTGKHTFGINKHIKYVPTPSLASSCVLTEFSIWSSNTLCISPQHALDQGDINFTYITDVIHSNELRLYLVGHEIHKGVIPLKRRLMCHAALTACWYRFNVSTDRSKIV